MARLLCICAIAASSTSVRGRATRAVPTRRRGSYRERRHTSSACRRSSCSARCCPRLRSASMISGPRAMVFHFRKLLDVHFRVARHGAGLSTSVTRARAPPRASSASASTSLRSLEPSAHGGALCAMRRARTSRSARMRSVSWLSSARDRYTSAASTETAIRPRENRNSLKPYAQLHAPCSRLRWGRSAREFVTHALIGRAPRLKLTSRSLIFCNTPALC